MLGKSHLTFGAGSYLCCSQFLAVGFEAQLIGLPAALIGSIFPDIDAFNARIKQNWIIWILTLPFTFLGHRTWSHSLFIVVILTLPVIWLDGLGRWLLLSFIIGYVSHILGDWMTPRGVPLLYPVKKGFSSPLTFRTGSVFEWFIALIPMLGYALFSFKLL